MSQANQVLSQRSMGYNVPIYVNQNPGAFRNHKSTGEIVCIPSGIAGAIRILNAKSVIILQYNRTMAS
jgi:hypothetical protein